MGEAGVGLLVRMTEYSLEETFAYGSRIWVFGGGRNIIRNTIRAGVSIFVLYFVWLTSALHLLLVELSVDTSVACLNKLDVRSSQVKMKWTHTRHL